MNNKKSFDDKLNNFFAGKGFYIVLFLCVAIIGVSTYYLLANRGTDVEQGELRTTRPPMANDLPSVAPPEVRGVTEPTVPIEDAVVPTEPENDPTAETDVFTQEEIISSSYYIWPVDGEVTLPYSVSALVFNEIYGDWRTHDGVQIAVALGTQVLAINGGIVESVAHDDLNGMTVIISHTGGLRSIYTNLASIPTVYEGDNVMTGEIIGSVGATAPGQSEENPHVTLKMTLDGQSIDPGDYLPAR